MKIAILSFLSGFKVRMRFRQYHGHDVRRPQRAGGGLTFHWRRFLEFIFEKSQQVSGCEAFQILSAFQYLVIPRLPNLDDLANEC